MAWDLGTLEHCATRALWDETRASSSISTPSRWFLLFPELPTESNLHKQQCQWLLKQRYFRTMTCPLPHRLSTGHRMSMERAVTPFKVRQSGGGGPFSVKVGLRVKFWIHLQMCDQNNQWSPYPLTVDRTWFSRRALWDPSPKGGGAGKGGGAARLEKQNFMARGEQVGLR